MNKYSIIIPIHNEVNHIPLLLEYLKTYKSVGHEVIIIDDGSTDGSLNILEDCKHIKLIKITKNKGKGYAVKEALKRVKYKRVIIFDGDLEIHPSEISKLMILNEHKGIKCALGYRFETLNPLSSNYQWGNFMFTSFFNILFNINYKDVLCCAKSFYIDEIRVDSLKSIGFDIDIELLLMLAFNSKNSKIHQSLVYYNRRTELEGKKLKISDGWLILHRIIKMIKFL